MSYFKDLILNGAQALVSGVFSRVPSERPAQEQLEKCRIIAHRGNGYFGTSVACENTLEAFASCCEAGVWGIECDIRWSKDNVPLILHDKNTWRVFGEDIEISTASFSLIREQVPEVPSLNEVIRLVQKQCHLMLEVKEVPTPKQLEILQNKLSGLIPVRNFHFMSLNLDVLDALETIVPREALVSIAELNVGYVFEETFNSRWGGYTGHYLLTSNKAVQQFHSEGIRVGTGFVDSENVFFREVSRGVDWVFSNRPDLLLNAVLAGDGGEDR